MDATLKCPKLTTCSPSPHHTYFPHTHDKEDSNSLQVFISVNSKLIHSFAQTKNMESSLTLLSFKIKSGHVSPLFKPVLVSIRCKSWSAHHALKAQSPFWTFHLILTSLSITPICQTSLLAAPQTHQAHAYLKPFGLVPSTRNAFPLQTLVWSVPHFLQIFTQKSKQLSQWGKHTKNTLLWIFQFIRI